MAIVRCRVMAAICRFFADEIAPFLVGLGMEEIGEARMKIRTLEKAAEEWDKEKVALVENGFDVSMTKDEYDRWYG